MPQLINWDSYNRALQEIKMQDNYGTAWKILNNAEMQPEQVLNLPAPTGSSAYGYKNYADGAIATWYSNYSSTVENVPDVVSQLNSNAGAGATNTYNWQFSANTDYSGGGSGGSTGSTFYGSDVSASGAGSAMSFIQNTVTPAVAAAGLGIKLGKAIDSALYNLNPDFWDNNGMATLNPETWNSITMDMSDSGWEGVLKRGFNAIFGLDSENNTSQMYIDADAAAYLAMYMQENGVFPTGGAEGGTVPADNPYETGAFSYKTMPATLKRWNGSDTVVSANRTVKIGLKQNVTTFLMACEEQSALITSTPTGDSPTTRSYQFLDYLTRDGKTAYYRQDSFDYVDANQSRSLFTEIPSSTGLSIAAWVMLFGNYDSGGGDMPEGITNQDGATQPDFSGCETPADYKQALQTQFPDMWQNAVTQKVAQPDGSVIEHTYIPVGTPTGTGNQPTTNPSIAGQSQGQTEVEPETSPQALAEALLEILTKTYTPTDTPTDTTNPPDTGEGDTPTVVAPTGSASALWSVYNPTQGELNSFGAWLWSSNFIDQLLKLFNDPMQSIIGVHKIFATPATSGSGNITVGYLNSGVSANLVSAQYTDVNCGSVSVREQFGNVFDYTDTQVRLYLPFIGIVDLDTSDVMRGTVSVVYHVDVITGACLAEVRVTRDGAGGTLYQFAGDAAVRYPISSGSYMGVVAGIASAVGGIASAVMTGGATLPIAAGAVAGGVGGARTNVQHSGSFSGNAGAMGAKKPYLIIERPQQMLASGFNNYQGYGANVIKTVAQCSGYFKMTDVHTDSITGASAEEVAAIKAALERGVIK